KGLEWNVVFLIGLADGRFPHARCLEPVERLEEERRLFYVAATRCQRYLELTVPLVLLTTGRPEICRPSRFLSELPANVVAVNRVAGSEYLRPYLGMGGAMSVDW
ncbi:MAG: 3'-5' exonuclease, partial [Gemmatimonadales bacterium]